MGQAMPLADIQQKFMRCLITPPTNSDDFLCQLSKMGTLIPEMQLAIYRSNINGAREKVLAQIYPACRNILGERYFNQLCQGYRFQYPSCEPDLNMYGKEFYSYLDDCLTHHEELEGFEYLPDLALLEWHWHEAYFAEDDETFDFDKLAQVPLEQQPTLVFKLSHAFSPQKSNYPVVAIWRANNKIPSKHQVFELSEDPVYYCIFRKKYQADIETLNECQFDLLTAIGQQHTLNHLSQSFAVDFQRQFHYCLERGWIIGFHSIRLNDVR